MNRLERVSCAVLPSRCCVCLRTLRPGEELCADCVKAVLTVPEKGYCDGCGRASNACLCEPNSFATALAAPFLYTGDIQKALRRFKFHNRPSYAVTYAKIAAKYADDCRMTAGADLITYIPMTKDAQRVRGYNQAALFAQALGEILGLPCRETLVKCFETDNQHSLSRLRRLGNLAGVFEVPEEMEALVRDQIILLADDISTTGSTCSEAAKTLRIFGAREVRCLCIARTPRNASR